MVDSPIAKEQRVVSSEAPQTHISTGEVAQPYAMLGQSLDKLGEGLEAVAIPFAERAGLDAVSTDDQGNLTVSHMPVFGEAGKAYSRAVKFSALAQGEAEAQRQDLALSKQFPNDPNGYLAASQAFKQKIVQQYNDQAGPEVGMALGKAIDNKTTYNYRWLLLQQQHTIKENFEKDTRSAINRNADQIESLIESGGGDTPEGRKAIVAAHDNILQIAHERVRNPILHAAETDTAIQLQQLDERFGAARSVAEVKKILNAPDGGPYKAMDFVQGQLDRKDISPTQASLNYAHGLTAIKDWHNNNAQVQGIANQQQKQKDQLFEDAVIRDHASENPAITEHDIKTSDASAESRMRMLSWVKRDGMPEPLTKISQPTTMDLFRRMSLPDGDPQRISDLGPVRDAYVNGKLKREDEEWLEKRFNEARTPEGDQLSKIRAQFSKAVEPSIDKSNPLLGKIDQSGKMQSYAFERFIDQKVDEYRKAGKSPYDLFTPGKPDYLGNDDVLQPFKVPLKESIKNIGRNLGAPGTAPAPAAPERPQRKPGESPAEYLKRTGGSMGAQGSIGEPGQPGASEAAPEIDYEEKKIPEQGKNFETLYKQLRDNRSKVKPGNLLRLYDEKSGHEFYYRRDDDYEHGFSIYIPNANTS